MRPPMMLRDRIKPLLTQAFGAAIRAAHPDALFDAAQARETLARFVAGRTGRIHVLGAGKASAAMARALARSLDAIGGAPYEGMVVCPRDYEVDADAIDVRTAGHPYPEKQSVGIAAEMLRCARDLSSEDGLIGLWSGGGSALLAAPPDGVSAGQFRDLSAALVTSGATIHELNTVRRHLSVIAGGRLARAAAPASLLNIVVSDVVPLPGAGPAAPETLAAIASGPCVPDPTTADEALAILKRHVPDAAPEIIAALSSPAAKTPSSWEEIGTTQELILADGTSALEAAASGLRKAGFEITELRADVTGEARDVAKADALRLGELVASGTKLALVHGGELTVTMDTDGKAAAGGPNQEYALALSMACEGLSNFAVLSADTDGRDGMGGAAGAFVFPDTLIRIRAAGIDPAEALAGHHSTLALNASGDLLTTGPTFTNVNDLRLIVING